MRRDGLEPSTLAYEASKLPLLYPAVGVVGLEPDDLSVKGRLLYQLSYTPVMDHDGVEPPTPRASIWRSTVELTIHRAGDEIRTRTACLENKNPAIR